MQKFIYLEPLTRVELVTPSLPRKCSTTELQRHLFSKKNERKECFSPPSVSSVAFSSGRRGSNPPPIAWKAIALPNELLPLSEVLVFRGGGWTRTTELFRGQIYSLLQLPLCDFPFAPLNFFRGLRADGGIRTPDPEITNHVLWPTELHRQDIIHLFK